MLHVGVLPHHDRWGDVLANLRFVVVDEAHVYRGVFGSHVANVLRRLRRLARVYGSEPQFVLASATIANPGELGGVAARRAGVGDRQRRRAGHRADDRALEPGAARRRARRPRQLARRCVAPARRPRHAGPADDLLREEPQGGRADPPLRVRARRAGDRGAAGALPRRLHAGAAPRDRAAPDRGRAARRHGDRRARARDRHRLARLRDLGRLPRHGRVAAPAVGARRPPQPRPRRARRERGRARPVLHARAGDAARAHGRGGDPRPREPARPRRPRPRGGVRGPDRRGGRADARPGGARCGPPSSPS